QYTASGRTLRSRSTNSWHVIFVGFTVFALAHGTLATTPISTNPTITSPRVVILSFVPHVLGGSSSLVGSPRPVLPFRARPARRGTWRKRSGRRLVPRRRPRRSESCRYELSWMLTASTTLSDGASSALAASGKAAMAPRHRAASARVIDFIRG